MTLRRGQEWGEAGSLPAGSAVVASDAELARLVTEARRNGRPLPEVGLVGGDLCRTLGGLGDVDRLRRGDGTRVTVDVGRVRLDGGAARWFVAHLAAHRWTWRGRFAVVMNAEYLGRYRLGPRAHPGDGLLDLTAGALGWRQRLQARSRARWGEHLPHPALSTARSSHLDVDLGGAVPVSLDHEPAGRAARIQVECEPAALRLVV